MKPDPLLEAAIFDMDGLLLDSEPFWISAEKYIFGNLGVQITPEEAEYTSRLSTAAVTQYWFAKNPWNDRSLADTEQDVITHVRHLILQDARPLPGVVDVLALCKNYGLKIGLATNCPEELIPEILRKIGIDHYFDAIGSSVNESAAKPAPDVYLSVARKLNVVPGRCIAFEDSVSGMQAAKQAGMTTIVVPHSRNYQRIEFESAEIRLKSLHDFTTDHLNSISAIIANRQSC